MYIFVPYSFWGFDAGIYLISAIIGFVVAYFAFKAYDITEHRSHFYLYLGFVLLSMGFLVLSLSSFYGVLNVKMTCTEACYNRIFDPDFEIRDLGYWIYYLASVVAYGLFALMYFPETGRMSFFILPVWYVFFPFFHLLSFFLISYVIFRSIIGHLHTRNTNSLLIMVAFISMGAFHVLLFLVSFSKIMYVIAHFILLFGFLSLFSVLYRINKKAGEGG